MDRYVTNRDGTITISEEQLNAKIAQAVEEVTNFIVYFLLYIAIFDNI